MAISNATDVFFDQLRDLYSANLQVSATLPDLINWSDDGDLTSALRKHLASTDFHLRELDILFENHAKTPGDDICLAMAGLIKGGNAHIGMAANPRVRNILLLAHARRIAFYVIAAAGFTRGMASHRALLAEVETVGGILDSNREFAAGLAGIASATYEIETDVP